MGKKEMNSKNAFYTMRQDLTAEIKAATKARTEKTERRPNFAGQGLRGGRPDGHYHDA